MNLIEQIKVNDTSIDGYQGTYYTENPEWIRVILDSEGKVISYRDNEGVKHEEAGIETNHLGLTAEGMTEFQQALKDSGFTPGGGGDYTDKAYMEIPMPRCAYVNITAPNGNAVWPTSKTNDYKYYMEFYDGAGNYFKKEIIFNAQGNSSMSFEKKNGKADFCNNNDWDDNDTFKMKIGNWVVQDSFHFKAYYTDFIRGAAVVAYQVADEVYKSRGVYADRPWKKALIDFSKITSVTPANLSEDGISNIDLQIDNGARCMPDGFPAIFYLNGEFYGIYSWQLSKNRDNYNLDKNTPEHIHLDGALNNANIWGDTVNWTSFEIRNPKNLYCMDGSKYDGDNPKELIDATSEHYDSTNKDHRNTAKVKRYILDLASRIPAITSLDSTDSAAAKVLFDTYFDADNLIDYELIQMAVGDPDSFEKNWQWVTYDGVKWYVCNYDKDMAFGLHWTGMFTRGARGGWAEWGSSSLDRPTGWCIKYYQSEHKNRWNELVNKGVFSTENIEAKINDWISRIGKDNYKKEWEKWQESPCNRNSNINFTNWIFTGGYRTISSGDVIWNNKTNYQYGDIVWFKSFDDDNYFEFKAVKNNVNEPCLTRRYTKYPKSMGFRDSIWRYFRYIEETISLQNEFVNSLNV